MKKIFVAVMLSIVQCNAMHKSDSIEKQTKIDFIVAVTSGDEDRVGILISGGISPEIAFSEGFPLWTKINIRVMVALLEDGTIFRKLIQECAKKLPYNSSKKTKLIHFFTAVLESNVEEVRTLLEQEIISSEEINVHVGDAIFTPLIMAIARNNEPMVTLLIKYGADPWYGVAIKGYPLTIAVAIGNNAIIIALLQAGAEPFYSNSFEGIKNLSQISHQAVQMLLDLGARPAMKDNLLDLESDLCLNSDRVKNIRMLVAAGAHLPSSLSCSEIYKANVFKLYEDSPLILAYMMRGVKSIEEILDGYGMQEVHYREISELMMITYGHKNFVLARILYVRLKEFKAHSADLIVNLRSMLKSAVASRKVNLIIELLALPELSQGMGWASCVTQCININLGNGWHEYAQLLGNKDHDLVQNRRGEILELLLQQQPSFHELEVVLSKRSANYQLRARSLRLLIGITRQSNCDPSSRLSLLPRDLIEYLIGPMVVDNRK